jgi:hypothetical protein
MVKINFPWERLAVIAKLAERAPSGRLGKTALMKCAYFLQAIKNVPLGYSFSLYSYGPFDSTVLEDLQFAEAFGLVSIEKVQYAHCIRFEIKAGDKGKLKNEAGQLFAEQYSDQIAWVLKEFGNWTAANLELASTIVYANRENESQTVEQLAKRVNEVKPHFTVDQIKEQIQNLRRKSLLNIAA